MSARPSEVEPDDVQTLGRKSETKPRIDRRSITKINRGNLVANNPSAVRGAGQSLHEEQAATHKFTLGKVRQLGEEALEA